MRFLESHNDKSFSEIADFFFFYSIMISSMGFLGYVTK